MVCHPRHHKRASPGIVQERGSRGIISENMPRMAYKGVAGGDSYETRPMTACTGVIHMRVGPPWLTEK